MQSVKCEQRHLNIRSKAIELGFDRIGFTPAEVPLEDQKTFESYCRGEAGANLEYLTKDPKKRMDVRSFFPGAQTIISLGVGYFQGAIPPQPGPGFGRVARYAWGLDYHRVISDRLDQLVSFLREELGQNVKMTRGADSLPLLEKSFARTAGLGFIGKNSVLIVPPGVREMSSVGKLGSWIFLGEIILDLPVSAPDPEPKNKTNCGDCTRCGASCPTNALDKPYTLDAGRCISYLTIENKGPIPRELRKKMGHWIFGCDDCQDVCSFNAGTSKTRWPEFEADQGPGPWVSLREVLAIPDQLSFIDRWAGTSFLRTKRKGLVRNSCVAAGNSQDESLIPNLKTLLTDPDPLVRGHAIWACGELLPAKERRNLAERLLKVESDRWVREECESLL